MEQNDRIKNLRERVKLFHEFLKNECEDITEAKDTIQFTRNAFDYAFERKRMETKISELSLEPATGQDKWEKLMEIISDLSVTDADIVIGGMLPAIEAEFNEKFGKHKVAELEINILD